MRAITIFLLVFAAIIVVAVGFTAIMVKDAIAGTPVINATEVLYESPIGKVFSPLAPVILIVFGIVCLIIFMIKKF
jgi:H+/Cl- antiporter ClcA